MSSLRKVDSIALTFDIWSARRGSNGFGCLTGHFINESFELKSLLLDHRYVVFDYILKKKLVPMTRTIFEFFQFILIKYPFLTDTGVFLHLAT